MVFGLLSLGLYYASVARVEIDATLTQLAYQMVERLAAQDRTRYQPNFQYLGLYVYITQNNLLLANLSRDYSILRIQCLGRMARHALDPLEAKLYLEKGLKLNARDIDKALFICLYLTNRLSPKKETPWKHDPFIYTLLETAETLIDKHLVKEPAASDIPYWTYKMFKLIVLSLKSMALLLDGYAQDALELARVGVTLLSRETDKHFNVGYPWAIMFFAKVNTHNPKKLSIIC